MRPSLLPVRRGAILALLAAIVTAGSAASTPLAAQQPACEPARTALVLAGGGSKGFTHIGVLRALDSLGVVPDLIVGTSMGAIIGALYASGLTATEVEQRIRDVPFDQIVRSYQPIVSTALGGLRPVLVWEEEPGHWVLQTGAVREAEVSAALSRLMLRANLLARGDFDRLPIPFRAVATDLDDRSLVSIGTGDVARAVRASMSIPLLLRPVVMDDRTLVDGGLSSNVPVGVARAMGAERVIVSTIASPRADPTAFDDPFEMTTQLFEFLWVQDSVKPRERDVVIAQPTAIYGMLDFRPGMLDSLVRVGRRTADAAFAGATCVRTLGRERGRRALPTTIGRVRVTPNAVSGRDAAIRAMQLLPRTTLDPAAVSAGLVSLASHERYRGVWLQPTGDSANVDFEVRIDEAPHRSFGIGFAFDHTMSGRIWMALVDREIWGRDLEGTALFTAGTWRRDLTFTARRQARVGERYFPIGGSLQLLTEDVRLWDGDTELPSVGAEEFGVTLGLQPLYEAGWSWEFGADYRLWQQSGAVSRGSSGARYSVRYLRAGSATPSARFEVISLHAWQRVVLDLSHTQAIGKLEVRPRVRAGWGRDLPIHQTFTLGGVDGFAGLRMLEQRGDHELFGSLLVRWPLWRQVHARMEPMVGVTGVGDFFEGPGTLDGVLLAGGRIGVDFDTPVGPIRIEQGFNNQNRRQALIRVGLWF